MNKAGDQLIGELVQQLCLADHLSDHEKKFLRYLLDHANEIDALSEEALARRFLGLENWTKIRTNVRALVSKVRTQLYSYFQGPKGRKERQQLVIPDKPPYHLAVVPNVPEGAVGRFWGGHLINGLPTLIIATEPLFFYDRKNRRFIRFLDINEDSLDNVDMTSPKLKGLTPCFHYQPSGEVHAAHHLAAWFTKQQHLAVEVKLSRECNDREPWSCNLVLLGNRRTNRFLKQIQKSRKLDFSLEDYQVANLNPRKHEQHKYQDLDKVAGVSYTYALVTRCPSKFRQFCATIIGANHGRAAQKVAEYLTSENALGDFFRKTGVDRQQPIPEAFQILFKVETQDFDLATGQAEPFSWKGF